MYVRLSPKSIFVGIVALGLPLAATVGWLLGEPAAQQTSITMPGGNGSLGTAPNTASGPAADRNADFRPTPSKSSASPSSAAPVLPAEPSTPGTGITISLSPLPSLTDPPVPTPTSVTSPPPSPSPTPSASDSTEAGIPLDLVGRR